MAINFKKVLLAGTALVAVSAFGSQAQAAAFAHTATTIASGATGTWAQTTNGTQGNATSATIATAGHGDSVNLAAGATLTVTNNGTADDGSANANTFDLGAVTNTAGTGIVAITSGGNNALTVTATSLDHGGAQTITGSNNANAAVTVTVSGNDTVGGALMLDNSSQATAAKTITMSVGGNLAVTGLTTLKTGTFVGAGGSTLTVTGNATFTGGLSLLATTNAANLAVVNLNGATVDFGSGTGAVIDDNTGLSYLNFGGTAAQTVTGKIDGTGATEGVVQVNNANGVTFNTAIGSANGLRGITIAKGSGNSSATFKAAVTAPITLGATAGTVAGVTFGAVTATDTNTVTFDGTTAGFTVTGAIAGNAAGEIDNIAVVGGNTITLATASTSNLDNLSVTGTSTKLTTGQNLTVTAATVGTGATLETSGNTLTTNTTLTGTLAMAGGAVTGTVDGSAAGTGTLAVTGNGTVTGNIGTTKSLSAITVATTKTLTATADVKATNITLTGTGALALATSTAHAVTGDIAAAVNGDGAITVADVNTAVTTITGNIGTSDKKIATLTITDGANTTTTTTTGNLYVNAISVGQNDTLQFLGTSAQTVSGTVVGAGAGKGILTVGNGTTASNVTFSGAVGGTTLASAGTSLAATATYAAGLNIAGAFTSAGTTNFTGTATSALTGAVTNTGTFTDTSTGLISTGAFTNSSGGTLTLGTTTAVGNTSALTSSAAVTNAGTINLASGTTLTAATQTAGAGTWNFSVSTDAATGVTKSAGKLALGGAADFTGTTINVNVPSTSGYIGTGKAFKVVDGVGAATGASSTAVAVNSDNSALLSFTFARGDNATVVADGITSDTSDIYVIATRASVASLGGAVTGNDSAVGNALNTIAGTGSTELDAIQGQLSNAADAAAVHRILESVIPTVDGSASISSLAAGAQVQGLAETRIASIRSGDALSGVAAGASANGWNLWVQGYGNSATQDEKSGVKGYDSTTLGGAVGVDSTSLVRNAVVGASFNYGKTNADSDNANTTDTDVDSYGLNVYGSYDLGANYFLNGQVGFAWNDIEIVRHNATGPGLGVSATGDTDSKQYSAKLGFGRDYAADHGLTLTPSLSAAYAHLKTEGYTETGAGGANLIVGSSSLNVLNLGVGGQATWNLKNSDGSTLKPALRAGYAYNLLNDKVDVTSSFTGDAAGTVFATSGASPDRSQFNAGAGVTYMTTANWDLSANYDYTFKSNYDSHTGTLRATSRF